MLTIIVKEVKMNKLNKFVEIIILGCLIIKKKETAFDLFKEKKDVISILIFSLVGIICLQFSFFKAIETSNAATATILQYLSPIFIVIYYRQTVRIIIVIAVISDY